MRGSCRVTHGRRLRAAELQRSGAILCSALVSVLKVVCHLPSVIREITMSKGPPKAESEACGRSEGWWSARESGGERQSKERTGPTGWSRKRMAFQADLDSDVQLPSHPPSHQYPGCRPSRQAWFEGARRSSRQQAGRTSKELIKRPFALLHLLPSQGTRQFGGGRTHGRATGRLKDRRRAGKQVDQDVVDPKGRQRFFAADFASLLLATCPMGQPERSGHQSLRRRFESRRKGLG